MIQNILGKISSRQKHYKIKDILGSPLEKSREKMLIWNEHMKKVWITLFTKMIDYLYISKLTAEDSQTKTKHQSVSEVEAGLEEA